MKETLTVRQSLVLNLLKAEADASGNSKVTLDKIAAHMGVRRAGAWNMILALIAKGLIAKTSPAKPQDGCTYTILGGSTKKRR